MSYARNIGGVLLRLFGVNGFESPVGVDAQEDGAEDENHPEEGSGRDGVAVDDAGQEDG